MPDSLGDRMKRYEAASRVVLTPRLPMIIRVDGKAFHTYTRGFAKPIDYVLVQALTAAARTLMMEVQGARLAYLQSDEISILATDYETHETQPWFGKGLQKVCSVAASAATASFNRHVDRPAMFDARAFVLPREEVCNYFVWRQQDAERNSVQGLAQAHYSPKGLLYKSCREMRAMLDAEKGVVWGELPTLEKRGWCVLKGADVPLVVDNDVPRFQEDRSYVERFVYPERNGL